MKKKIEAFKITDAIYDDLMRQDHLETSESFFDWPDWLQSASEMEFSEDGCFYIRFDTNKEEEEICINTLEGRQTVSPGDWIIKGIKGELYPCKPDVFLTHKELYGRVEIVTQDLKKEDKCQQD